MTAETTVTLKVKYDPEGKALFFKQMVADFDLGPWHGDYCTNIGGGDPVITARKSDQNIVAWINTSDLIQNVIVAVEDAIKREANNG